MCGYRKITSCRCIREVDSVAALKKHVLIATALCLIPIIIAVVFMAAVMSVFAAGAASDSDEALSGALGENLPEGLTYSVVELCVQVASDNGLPASILIGQIILSGNETENNDVFRRGKDYGSLEEAVWDYADYVTTGQNAHLKLLESSAAWIAGLKNSGLIGDAYAARISDIIKSYNLERFDGITTDELEKMLNEGDGKATGNFIWPLPERGVITSYFGDRIHPVYGYKITHTGTDIAASQGTPILAADGGTVIFSGWLNSDGGYTVIIDHGGNLKTQYCHIMEGGLMVTKGQKVSQGQQIAKMGSTGASTGPHLHFAVLANGVYVNGLDYVTQPYI